jgi:hypothetical protein
MPLQVEVVVDDALYSFRTLSDWGLVLSILLAFQDSKPDY